VLKVLLLNNRVPYPLKDGGAKAAYSLIRGLAPPNVQLDCFFLNTKKHFLSQADIDQRFDFVHKVKALNINTDLSVMGALKSLLMGKSYNISRFDQTHMHKQLKELLSREKYDVVHFENLFMAPYLSTVRANSTAKCVLRMHNVEYQIWEKLAQETESPLKRRYIKKLSKQLKSYEERFLPKFDALVPISQEDLEWAKKYTNQPLLNLPMGMDFEPFKIRKQGKHFFHIGSMEWLPNQHGCAYLVNEIWPEVIKQDPDCHLHLAGKGMDAVYKHWETERIHIHGEVESARDFMLSHNVMLIPLKSASGLRIKALEAMGLGIPIISSTIGMSGLLKTSNDHFLSADLTAEWVESILKISKSPTLHEQLSKAGYTFVNQHFEAKAVSEQLINFYENLIK